MNEFKDAVTKGKRRLSEAEKDGICMEAAAGRKHDDIAVEYGVSRRTVVKVWKDYRERVERETGKRPIQLRDRLKSDAVRAVHDGLKDRAAIVADGGAPEEFDLYRRAGLGVKVLEGVGEFQKSVVHSHMHRLESLPPDWQERYGYVAQGIEVEQIPAEQAEGEEQPLIEGEVVEKEE